MLRLYHAALRHTEELHRFLAQFDLTTIEFVTLRVLRREPPPHVMTPSALHETLVLSPGGMTKILKQLEAKGLVSRRADLVDKRSNLVELTARGQAAIEAAQSAVRELDVALLERTLSDREQQRLAQLLRKLLMSLDTLAKNFNDSPSQFLGPLGKSRKKIERERKAAAAEKNQKK